MVPVVAIVVDYGDLVRRESGRNIGSNGTFTGTCSTEYSYKYGSLTIRKHELFRTG